MSKPPPPLPPSPGRMIRNSTAEFLIFTAQAGEDSIEVRIERETVWLSQKMLAELFGVDRTVITKHLKNVFDDKELDEDSVCANFAHTAADGKTYATRFYNLDAIISVGYRVNSRRATQFRQWATRVLRDFAIRGYVLDRKRLENGAFLGEDYFERLLQEIREIRLSERRLHQKLTDIYATAVDYDPNAAITREFFATVQNKLHYAIHGHTAAELIKARADAGKPNMGLTTWENAPSGRILKADVAIAKNYLTQEELDSLGRTVNAWLELAEDRAKRRLPTTMADWAKRLDMFIDFADRPRLDTAGKVSAQAARDHAEGEFERYRLVQERLLETDFDRAVCADPEDIAQLEEMERGAKGRERGGGDE